jgi:hypothetical protein
MSASETPPQPPAAKQAGLEKKTSSAALWAAWAQVVGTVVAALAFLVAIYVAYQGQEALRSNVQIAERQAQDNQSATAVRAIQSGTTQGASLGMLLLGENTLDRITRYSQTGEPPTEVSSNYNAALQIIADYLTGSHIAIELCPSSPGSQCFGQGWGPPTAVPVTTDAANQIDLLLSDKTESEVTALKTGHPSGIDLSGDELAVQQFPYINFGWIPDVLVRTDLRGANLSHSQWSGESDLSYSYLQCANLRGADFRRANLTGADLRGANIAGADFRGAHITGALITPIYGTPKWPGSLGDVTPLPATEWNQSACLGNSHYWDNHTGTGTGGPGTGTGNGH